ncbi:MAG: SET domain-containing protein-lysine N-methyltransferase [Nevskia sp.]|nr:SET domain-containing protein-lysine N-methyltransferase [Nevskia sp.]
MIVPAYRIAASAIPQAGQGLFLEQPAARGAVLVAPDKVHTLMPETRLRGFAEDSIEVRSSVRWFEDWYSITPEWSDECYVNHSFEPSGLWHLGFIFALRDLPAGTELTIDYRLVIGSGEVMPFKDSASGQPIVGLPWADCLRRSTQLLSGLIPG